MEGKREGGREERDRYLLVQITDRRWPQVFVVRAVFAFFCFFIDTSDECKLCIQAHYGSGVELAGVAAH